MGGARMLIQGDISPDPSVCEARGARSAILGNGNRAAGKWTRRLTSVRKLRRSALTAMSGPLLTPVSFAGRSSTRGDFGVLI